MVAEGGEPCLKDPGSEPLLAWVHDSNFSLLLRQTSDASGFQVALP